MMFRMTPRRFTVIRYVSLVGALVALLISNPTSWVMIPLVVVFAVSVAADVLLYVWGVWGRDHERVHNRDEDEIRTGRTAQERVAA